MGEKVSVYTSVHRTVSYQPLDHHPLEGDTESVSRSVSDGTVDMAPLCPSHDES